MKVVTAYRADDGSLHDTSDGARRRDDAAKVKPLMKFLDNCLTRAKEAGLDPEFGFLEFLRKNEKGIRPFFLPEAL